jgi:hypothetical protein
VTAQELRDKFESDLKNLQDTCLHENKEWMPYAYAPGHYSAPVWVCTCCDKIIDQRPNQGGTDGAGENVQGLVY